MPPRIQDLKVRVSATKDLAQNMSTSLAENGRTGKRNNHGDKRVEKETLQHASPGINKISAAIKGVAVLLNLFFGIMVRDWQRCVIISLLPVHTNVKFLAAALIFSHYFILYTK